MINYYHILGLNENATSDEIKRAFKKLAVQYHPDKHPGRLEMEEKFKEINEAHQVLSDPYEKSRFDLKLKYQQFTPPEPTFQSAYPRSNYHRRYTRHRYYGRVDHKTNIKATAYAFGITFILALIIMSGIWAKDAYDAKQLAEMIAERRELYLEARSNFEKEKYDMAFEQMSTFTYFRSDEKDIRAFKESMIGKMISFGNDSFLNDNYYAAIRYFEMIQEFQPDNPFYEERKKLAEAYRKTEQFEKARKIVEGLLVNEFEIIGSLVFLADTYKEQNNFGEAKTYYDVGHTVAKKGYEAFFGKGYPIVIKNEYLPDSHYHLYSGIADNYLKMENYQMAIKAAEWNKYVWPDSADAYIVSGHAYFKLGQSTVACEEYIQAMNRGWGDKPPVNCF